MLGNKSAIHQRAHPNVAHNHMCLLNLHLRRNSGHIMDWWTGPDMRTRVAHAACTQPQPRPSTFQALGDCTKACTTTGYGITPIGSTPKKQNKPALPGCWRAYAGPQRFGRNQHLKATHQSPHPAAGSTSVNNLSPQAGPSQAHQSITALLTHA